MNKEDYLQNIGQNALSSALFITSEIHLLNKEIEENCRHISIQKDLAQQISVQDFSVLLSVIKSEAKNQLRRSTTVAGLIFYLWHDEMAGQLRYNFINEKHNVLPFTCKLNFTNSEEEIVREFLNSAHLEGILFEEFRENKEAGSAFILNVYKEIISKTQ